MGNNIPKDFNVRTEYARLVGMPAIYDHDFEVEFEKECFMSINIIRQNPKTYYKHFEQMIEHKAYEGKQGKKLLKLINDMLPGISMAPLQLDKEASKACYLNS